METTKIIQLNLPENVNHKLKILAITGGQTLKDYCTKVLTEHANSK